MPGPYNFWVQVSDFHYQLPQELIAQEPLPDRSASRLLHLERASGVLHDRCFRDFPELLRPDDLVVFNNTRVFPARLYGSRSGSKSQPVSPRNPAAREFLVRPGRKIGIGEKLFFGDTGQIRGEVIERGKFGQRKIRFSSSEDFFALVESIGHVPLPPYIARPDNPEDRERYQTIYARERGSVAAPTAGLHFTPEILARIRERGIETAEITLHVGLGTFQPVRVERVEDHKLHRESYVISSEAADKINRALNAGRRIVAVGTTTVRALEHSAKESGRVAAGRAEAGLFIYPAYEFRVVRALLTNFHLPQSTLLMLVCAFGGTRPVLAAYRHAVEQRYRFYSHGDCMLLE